MPKSDLINQTAKLLGFHRVTKDVYKYVEKSIDKYKDCNRILEINGRFTFNNEEKDVTYFVYKERNEIKGWAWNPNFGWICFGEICFCQCMTGCDKCNCCGYSGCDDLYFW